MSPTSFSPVSSKNVGICLQNILTSCFNLFDALLENVKAIPSASPKLLNLNQEHPSKNCFFLWKFYKIESCHAIFTWHYLQYNLSHVVKFSSWRHEQKLWYHNLYFEIIFILRGPRVANFAEIFKTVII